MQSFYGIGQAVAQSLTNSTARLTALAGSCATDTNTSNDATCRSVTCPAGDTQCSDAYLFPSDDQATRACPSNTNMVLNLGPA